MADGGGAQRYVLTLAKHFKGSVAAGNEAHELFDEAKNFGIPNYPLKHLKRNISPWHDVLAIGEMMTLIKTIQPDIIHLNSSKAGFLGSVAGKLAGKKVVFTAHGFFYFKRSSFFVRIGYTAVEKFASYFRDLIIAVSDEDKKLAEAHTLLLPEKIISIHNGIAPIEFIEKTEAKKSLGLSKHKFIFGNIAQYYNRKGLDIFIESVSLLPFETRKNIQVALVGEGPQRKELEHLIAQKGLDDVFVLIGFTPNGSHYLKAFDAFVLPSRREGFPYVLLEALQAGLPIIATNVGGVPEALGDAGIVIEAENTEQLTNTLELIFSDSNKREELSKKAMIQGSNFTESLMLKQTESVYRKLME